MSHSKKHRKKDPQNSDALLRMLILERLKEGEVSGVNTFELIKALGLTHVVGKKQFERVMGQLIKKKLVESSSSIHRLKSEG